MKNFFGEAPSATYCCWKQETVTGDFIMQELISSTLKRDCEVVQIPIGTPVVLPSGTEFTLTQSLGGSFTIQAQGGLYRVAARDAEALGLSATDLGTPERAASQELADEGMVWEALKSCYDPEIPVNIVDLGLIYDMGIETLPSGKRKVFVKMTLTAPGCGMGTVIAADAQQKILALPGVEDASVEVVWDPPWHHSMITAAGRKTLGME
jgi:probable FeS assembly SUF system protein SufT